MQVRVTRSQEINWLHVIILWILFYPFQIQKMVISGGHFKPEALKPKEVVSLLLDDAELECKCKSVELKLCEWWCAISWLAIPLKMITCKDTGPRTVVLLLLAVHKHGVRSVKGGGSLCGLCRFWADLCTLYDLSSSSAASWKESWWTTAKKGTKTKEDGASWGLYANL